jgi:D-alanine-D-alanine ligase
MCVAIVYNKPTPSHYTFAGEQKAVLGVLDEVVAVRQALLASGHSVICIPLVPPLEAARKELSILNVDLVFNLFEGFCGYSGTEPEVPEILSELGIPYTGCPPNALRLALDKAATKDTLKAGGLDTPDFQLLNSKTLPSFRLNYPCIVKPRYEDGSHGISEESVISDFSSLERQLTRIIQLYGGEQALVEEFIDGQEFNATVMGNSKSAVLAISEIAFSLPQEMPRILTFAAKWVTNSLYFRGTRPICPARISRYDQQRIAGIAQEAFLLTGCRGYARVDMRKGKDERLAIIDVNPNPDISPGSGAALQAKATGLNYQQFINKITSLALEVRQR